jgi:hypothetical protein
MLGPLTVKGATKFEAQHKRLQLGFVAAVHGMLDSGSRFGISCEAAALMNHSH